jgi:hypothetical protein
MSALCSTRGAAAQRNVDISTFTPALDADSFIGVQGTRTPGPDRVSIGLFTDYGSSLLNVGNDGDDLALVKHRLAGQLSIEGGIGGRAALALSMPLILYQSGDTLAPEEPKLPVFATRDPWVHFRYRLFGDPSGDSQQRQDGPGIALQVGAGLPAGDEDAWAGEGQVRTEAQLLADMHLLGAGIGASIGYRHRFESEHVFNVKMRDQMTFGAGLELPIPPLYPLSALLEMRGATDFKSSATTALEAELGARLRLGGGVVITLAGGLGFNGAIGTPGARVIAGLWWAPSDSDSDHDGIPDSRDACPPLPEDLDGFQDTDGCPDPDNDNDLVPDIDDLCPNVEAIEGRDDDEDGCTDK